jgi:hypothetical protein
MRHLSRRNAIWLAALLGVGAAAEALPGNAAEPPLALKGYDPVAYFTRSRAVQGSPAFEYEWDELRYRFASAEHRDMFKADPIRYAPQFAAFCAMALARGEVVEADPESWLINDGKLYLFGKNIGPDLFSKDLHGNISKAEQNRRMIEKR